MLRTAALWTLLVSAACLLPLAAPYQEPAEGQGPAEGEGPVVRVAQGLLRGRRVQRPSDASISTLYAFQGVPYAKPPVGHRRFKDPEEAEPWNGVRDATQFGNKCVQKIIDTGNVTGEEDCLFINVFTADPPHKWPTHKRPVVMYIHGGAFVQWSGNTDLVRPDPLLKRGVVFVSFNYRLGVLGFLNTEDSEAPGNAGLKDQLLALRWVKANIAAFGGDPEEITIAGESAGAGSVHLHMLSPQSRGLFKRAMSISGTALSEWAIVPRPRQHAQALRRRWASACPGRSDDEIVQCLRQVPAQDLVFNQYDIPQEEGQYMFGWNAFRPGLENPRSSSKPFITTAPITSLTEGKFAKVPFYTGFTSGEGILYLGFGRLLWEQDRWTQLNDNFTTIMRWYMPMGLTNAEVARKVRTFYFGNRTLADGFTNIETKTTFIQMCTDIFFAAATVTSARIMSERGGKVYVYQFSRDGPIGFTKQSFAPGMPGVTHGDDMVYVFDFVRPGTEELLPIPESEKPIRDRQADIFANFIKTGNPTPADSGLLHWPAFTPRKESYMDMDVQLSARDHALGERIAFWRSLLADARSPAATNGVRHPGGRKA